jgi:hypothetical protein
MGNLRLTPWPGPNIKSVIEMAAGFLRQQRSMMAQASIVVVENEPGILTKMTNSSHALPARIRLKSRPSDVFDERADSDAKSFRNATQGN